MPRLVLIWFMITTLSVGFMYFVDRMTKRQVGRWGFRFISVGTIVAIVFGLIIFFERF